MRLFTRLFTLQLKRYIKEIPACLITTAVFLVLIGLIGTFTYKYFNSEEELVKAKVVLTGNGLEGKYSDFALSYVESMKAVSDTVSFEILSEEKAEKEFAKGDVIAVMYIPEDVSESILNGDNIPINIKFNNSNILANVFFTEITRNLASILTDAQAGVFATYKLYEKISAPEDTLSEDIEEVNFSINFKYALRYEDTFKDSQEGLIVYNYIISFIAASAIIIILLMASSPFASILSPDNTTILNYGKTESGFKFKYYLARLFSLTILYFIVHLLLFSLIYFIGKGKYYNYSIQSILLMLITSFIFSGYLLTIFQLSVRPGEGILINFAVSFILLFIGGELIPGIFLPDSLSLFTKYNPLTYIHNGYLAMLGLNSVNYIPYLIIMGILLITSFLSLNIKKKNK